MFNRKEYDKQYRKENHKKLLEYQRQWRKNNPQKMKEQNRQYYENHPEKRECIKKWQTANPEKFIKYRDNQKENHKLWMNIKRKTDLKFNLSSRISKEIYKSLKGNKSKHHWENLIGYTLNNLIKHLKKTIPKGYTWNDYLENKLQLDHILPIRLFQFKTSEDEEFKQCWNLHNLQLLTKEENLSKRDKIINPILLGLLLKGAA